MNTRTQSQLITSDVLYVVVGLGETGMSVVDHLVDRGKRVVVFDTRAESPNRSWLSSHHPEVELFEQHVPDMCFMQPVRWIVSPGVRLYHPMVAKAIAEGAEILGDLDLFMESVNAPVIGITGSNGKSTVTTLVAKILSESGHQVAVGGNLSPAALTLIDDSVEVYVLEMSSFQLERAGNLGLDVASVLNISADHLDRHGSMAAYHAAKHRIFRKAKRVVLNDDDVLTQPLIDSSVKVTRYATKAHRDADYKLLDEAIWWGDQRIIGTRDIGLEGRHNHVNAMAACAIAAAFGATLPAMASVLSAFYGLEHRCERVPAPGSVTYINDSKATNVGATQAAIEGLGLSGPLILLLGGQAKGQEFGGLRPAVNEYVKYLITFGEAAHELAQVGFSCQVDQVETLEQAFALAQSRATSGDRVVLSPACASLDQFQDYRQRGNRFKQLVMSDAGGAR